MASSHRISSAVLAILFLPGLASGAQQKTKVAPTASSAAASKKTVPAKSPATAKSSTKAPAKKPARLPIGQKSPARDRYQEIQQALADAGYFDGPVDGLWSKSSVQALQNFQSAHGLEPTGKIDAQTLIRLNLGPQYEQPDASESAADSVPSG